MSLFSTIAASGIWSALPLTGSFVFLHHYKAIANPVSRVTAFSLMTVAGIAVWSVPMLAATIFGIYHAEFFGLIGWIVTLFQFIRWLRKQKKTLFISLRLSFWDWILAIGLVLVAVLYFCFPTESILGGRDQGVYANHGIYIAHHGRLDVPYPWNASDNSVFDKIFEGLPGFFRTKPTMTVQFAHLFPVWLAQAFSTLGYHGLFCTNGILALLSLGVFYGFCRYFLPKPYAVVATLFLGLNPSEIWLARITLTEIFAQLLIWSGILLLLQSLRFNSKALARWAGIFIGLSTLVRIDDLLFIPLFLFTYLILKFVKYPLCEKINTWFNFYQSLFLVSALSIFYYACFSAPYLHNLYPLLLQAGITTIVTLLLILVTTQRVASFVHMYATSKICITLITIIIILLAVYACWIRPTVQPYAVFNLPVKTPLNGLRDYREDSLNNLCRYLSPFVVWSAILGWLAALWTVARQKQDILIVPIVVIGSFSIIYLWNPHISPDHFFAIRRFVPIVIPGFAFFSSLGICWLINRLPKTWCIVASVFILILFTIFITNADASIITFSENQGYFMQLQRLSDKLPKDKLILANGSTTWVTPLYIAFDRKVVPINISSTEAKNAVTNWVSQQISEQKPVYILNEEQLCKLKTLSWKSSKLDEIVLSRSFIESTVKPLPKKILHEQKMINLYKIAGLSNRDYPNALLGAEWVWDVQEAGFSVQEWLGDKPFRWSNGRAKLVVSLDEQHLPKAIAIELASTGPKGTRLSVLVNGKELFNNQLRSGNWSNTLSLTGIKLEKTITIELLSDTWIPQQMIKGSQDSRTLGVAILGIKLVGDN
ncbi:MAG: hypothetical protein JOZ78_11670 [Chroococcidiopsidaceae cyanobacterium CP_BM_ER_R8_30]|nr:hypothetical protein [Chroococcidiopsidaceae cyanobacterium CP_BM_ER_R8_30]